MPDKKRPWVTKTLKVREKTYHDLDFLRGKRDTFDDVINSLLRNNALPPGPFSHTKPAVPPANFLKRGKAHRF